MVKQHMWGGYQWNRDGSLVEDESDLGGMKCVFDLYRLGWCSSGMTSGKQFMVDHIQAEYMMSALVFDISGVHRAVEREYEHMRDRVKCEIRSAIAMMYTQLYVLSGEEIESVIY